MLVSPDTDLRERVASHLETLHWTVSRASGGAEALALLGQTPPEAMIVDHWLPDLQPAEFVDYVAALYPATDLLHMDGGSGKPGQGRSVRYNELVHVLRMAADAAGAGAEAARQPSQLENSRPGALHASGEQGVVQTFTNPAEAAEAQGQTSSSMGNAGPVGNRCQPAELPDAVALLPDVVGDSAGMRELSRMVRLVAPHSATVLVLGETGTGKELVAKAVHRLSSRAAKPFMVLNCAAIPEQLLEAELFGHTRGAFTGAVTSRMGRIEAAHGGTLFLDEIGEMPLALQAKMLRFLESGEVQRVGDNETSRVDVRIVAATHQPLLEHAEQNRFRLDLYHRLAVFPVEIPPLRTRAQDIPMLVGHLLALQETSGGPKAICCDAMERLRNYPWQGNVRELGHVILRAIIMAGSEPIISSEHLRMRAAYRG